MKSNLELLNESLEHWERMVERCKWLVESNLNNIHFSYYFENIIGETPMANDCPLCKEYLSKKLHYSDCDKKDSPWKKTMSISWGLEIFIKNAEKYMIPALNKCIEIEKGKLYERI